MPAGRPTKYSDEYDAVDLYVLRCPRSGEIRYAGKANNAEQRLKSHLRDAHRRNTPVYCWIRALLADGLTPKIEVVSRSSIESWQLEEKLLIAELRAAGARLLNLAEGGEQPYMTAAQRAENGKKAAVARTSNPSAKRIYELKRAMGQYLRWSKTNKYASQEKRDAICAKLRFAARLNPRLFGVWADVS